MVEEREALAHLRTCEACERELVAMRSVEVALTAPVDVTCAAAQVLISARIDGEADGQEDILATRHLTSCAACRAFAAAASGLDDALTALPGGRPSAQTDRQIGELVTGRVRRQKTAIVTGVLSTSAVALVAVMLVVSAVARPGATPQAAGLPTDTRVFVASVQQSVYEPRTSTLYVLRPEGVVAALDAATNVERARITVGGTPSALALNDVSNRIVVLDSAQKTVTEIDVATNTVVAETKISMDATPTAIKTDGNGKIVVTAVKDGTSSSRSSAPPSGVVAVLGGGSVDVRAVEVVPQFVALEPNGARALLVSAAGSTIADAATFATIGRMPGGVAGTFGSRGETAVISAFADGTRVTLSSAAVAIDVPGSPVAVVAVPEGFAVLVHRGTVARVVLLAPTGEIYGEMTVGTDVRALSYDTETRKLAQLAANAVTFAAVPALSATASTAPSQTTEAQPTSAPTATPQPTPTGTPSGTPPVTRAATPKPAQQLSAPVPDAQPAWAGVYRLDLGGRRAVLSSGGGARIWYVDDLNAIQLLDTRTGARKQIVQLPVDARPTFLEASNDYLYALDATAGQLYGISLATQQMTVRGVAFGKGATAFAVTPNDRAWAAVQQGDRLFSFDSLSRSIEVFTLRADLIVADSAGRLWFSDDGSGTYGIYDPQAAQIVDIRAPHRGRTTSLTPEGSGLVWAGTDAGELLALRSDGLRISANASRPVAAIAASRAGTWYLTRPTDRETWLAPMDGHAAAQIAPGTVRSLYVDDVGRVWLADPDARAFYIVITTEATQ
jgi:streptogramin lyase